MYRQRKEKIEKKRVAMRTDEGKRGKVTARKSISKIMKKGRRKEMEIENRIEIN